MLKEHFQHEPRTTRFTRLGKKASEYRHLPRQIHTNDPTHSEWCARCFGPTPPGQGELELFDLDPAIVPVLAEALFELDAAAEKDYKRREKLSPNALNLHVPGDDDDNDDDTSDKRTGTKHKRKVVEAETPLDF